MACTFEISCVCKKILISQEDSLDALFEKYNVNYGFQYNCKGCVSTLRRN
jgi:hypothetical protein